MSTVINAQIVNIPDANFKNALVNRPCVDLNGDGNGDVDADTNNDGQIQQSEAEAVLRLDIAGEGISDLEGIQSFLNLEYLRCGSNNITSLEIVTQNLNLKGLVFEHLGLTNLDVTQMSNLEELNCHDNALTVLDVSQNSNLETLICNHNQLTSLDISQNLQLKTLSLHFNSVTSINVTPHQSLEHLSVVGNAINILDVTQNLNLISLGCGDSQLNSLDVSQNLSLESLGIRNTELTSLDVSQNYNLKGLDCSNNLLTSLDISNNPNIFSLECENNQLVSLNLKNGNNTILVNMKARDNPNLECIQVDDEAMANSKVCITSDPLPSWCKDATASYSEECILGTEEYSGSDFKIFPNPVENILYINTKEAVDSVSIYSVTGSLIKQTSSSNINVADLPVGLYFAKITINSTTITKKFIKR